MCGGGGHGDGDVVARRVRFPHLPTPYYVGLFFAGRSALAAVFFRVRYGGAGTERRAVLYATSHVRERSCSILVWLARPPRAAAVRRGMLDRGRWLGYSTVH